MSNRDAAFTDFVTARSRSLLRSAYLLEGSHQGAEDLLQTALVKTYVAWSRIRAREAVESYTRTCMIRAHLRGARKRAREVTREFDLPDERQARALVQVDDRDQMWAVVQTLPARQRATVVLRFYEGLNEAETAAILGCTAGTVKSQTSRALAKLREAMTSPTTTEVGDT